jgi:hypothetical protein
VTRTQPSQKRFRGLDFASPAWHFRGMWLEETIRAVAARQHGLVHRPQLLGLGVSAHEVARRLGTGRLELLHPGVYYLDSAPATWKTLVLAGVLAAGPDALASHRTAAVMWDFDAIRGRMIEVTVPYRESPEPEDVILHRTRRTNPERVADGIPITSPEKSLLDLARFIPERTLQKAARSAVRKGITTPEMMDLAIRTHGGRGVAGTRKFRRVVAFVADDQSGSVSEIDLKHLVMNAPVPRPIQQLKVRLPDGANAFPDFAWPDRLRIVEADGFESHGTPEAMQHDLRRQNQLMDLGWGIRRFTATEIRDEPDRVLDEIVSFVNKPFREG